MHNHIMGCIFVLSSAKDQYTCSGLAYISIKSTHNSKLETVESIFDHIPPSFKKFQVIEIENKVAYFALCAKIGYALSKTPSIQDFCNCFTLQLCS